MALGTSTCMISTNSCNSPFRWSQLHFTNKGGEANVAVQLEEIRSHINPHCSDYKSHVQHHHLSSITTTDLGCKTSKCLTNVGM